MGITPWYAAARAIAPSDNRFRNVMYEESLRGGMVVEKEKANLLPGRPTDDGIKEEGDARRPADIWWKGGKEGRNEAWDFAATSGMRADRVGNGGSDQKGVGAIILDYEKFKRT